MPPRKKIENVTVDSEKLRTTRSSLKAKNAVTKSKKIEESKSSMSTHSKPKRCLSPNNDEQIKKKPRITQKTKDIILGSFHQIKEPKLDTNAKSADIKTTVKKSKPTVKKIKTEHNEILLLSSSANNGQYSGINCEYLKSEQNIELSSTEIKTELESEDQKFQVCVNKIDLNYDSIFSSNNAQCNGVKDECLTTNFNDEECSKVYNDDDSSESEWEEVAEQTEEQILEEYKPNIPEGGVEITIDCPDLKLGKRKKKAFDEMNWIRLCINRERKEVQLNIHKTHLLCLLGHTIYLNNILNSSLLQGMAISILPSCISDITGKKANKIDVEGIGKLVKWFKSMFECVSELKKTPFVNISNDHFIEYFENRKVQNTSEYNLLFLIFARTLGLKTRLCMSLYPVSYKAKNLLKKPNPKNEGKDKKKPESKNCEDKTTVTSSPKKKKSKKKTVAVSDKTSNKTPSKNRPQRGSQKSYKNSSDESCGDPKDSDFMSDGDDFTDEPKPCHSRKKTQRTTVKKANRKVLSSDSEQSSDFEAASTFTNTGNIQCWVEVFSKPNKEWVPVESSRNIVNKPYEIEIMLPKPVTYIISCDEDSYLKDVTRRYCSEYMTSTIRLRADASWWEETLEPFLPPNSKVNKEEEENLEQLLVNKPLPKTVAAFKNHPLYVLQRHLLKFEAIYPPDAAPVGFLRDEPVYLRESVAHLHSRETWLKEARVIRIGEEAYKIVKARPKWDRMACVMRTDIPLDIFGFWQTDPYEPPTAVDGKVPRNEYGNVELFKPCMLPKGTVHLQLPGLNRVAKKLGIDCSPAVTGFDGHKGSIHPVFDGFVVCEEYKDTILAAWDEDQENARIREKEKREKRIYGNWKKLIKGLLIKERIKLKYDVNYT